jgi:signal transduction histidine kinase
MDTQFLVVLSSIAANFILVVLILLHLRHSLSGNYLLLIIFGLSGWAISNYYSNLDFPYIFLLWLNRLIFITTSIAAWGFACFADAFPDEKGLNRKRSIMMLVALLTAVIISASPYLAKNVFSNGAVTDINFGWGIVYYGIFILTCLVYTIGKIIRKFFVEKNQDTRELFKLLTYGVGIFLFLAIITNLILPVFFNQFEISVITPAYTTAFSFIIFTAILKHKFLDIKVVATELLTFSIWIFLLIQTMLSSNVSMGIVNGIIFVLVIIFGIYLIRSVKLEVERKEELQVMADRLASANDQLRKLDNAKTEFISVASHQLRTPITSIKGFASLVLEGAYGEMSGGVRKAVEKVYVSTERLVNLIEDLLNVSRIESGRLSFNFEKSSVEKLLKELRDNFVLVAKNKKLNLTLKLPKKPLPEITMDYQKVRELTSNFIDNALKYTEKGGVTVSAELRNEGVVVDDKGFVIPGRKSPFGKVIRIIVSDTGIGIPKEEIPYLFRKFSRGKDISRLHVGGTGLGLYVGKAIADAHHGQTWVESDGAGKGSRFMIEIPVEGELGEAKK